MITRRKKHSSGQTRVMSLHRLVHRTSNPHRHQDGADATDPNLPLDYDMLEQGSLYVLKIQNVTVALFQGWYDDMCCFAILRSETIVMRWSEARYLPGDFVAYPAFDESGNPPIQLWTKLWQVDVPTHWFAMFEEARRKQREWKQASMVSGTPSTDVIDPHVLPMTAMSSPLSYLPSVSTLATDQRPIASSRPTSTALDSAQDQAIALVQSLRDSNDPSSTTDPITASPTVETNTASSPPHDRLSRRSLSIPTVPRHLKNVSGSTPPLPPPPATASSSVLFQS